MKSTPSTSKSVKKTATPATVKPTQPIEIEEHSNYVATAAYYKAESRGFAPGHETEDWLEAEAELETRFATMH